MTKLKIKVTKDILERSKMCINDETAPTNCAIALAVRDIFPDARVGGFNLSFDGTYKYFVSMPVDAILFIRRFDSTPSHLRPQLSEIEFEIEVPDEVTESINIDELKPLLQNHPNLQLVN